MKCDICGCEIAAVGPWKSGNNAVPVVNGRCCDRCNSTVVIPARLGRSKRSEPVAQELPWDSC